MYCNRSCLFVGLFVGLLPRQLEIACIDPHQTGFVGKGSDHLQLIKFWPSCAPRKGVCGGAKMFGSALLQPARSVCVSSECFFISRCSDSHNCCYWLFKITDIIFVFSRLWNLWLGGRVVREPDLRSAGRGFESRPPRCRVQPWTSCLHTHVPLSPSSTIWYQPMGVLLGDWRR